MRRHRRADGRLRSDLSPPADRRPPRRRGVDVFRKALEDLGWSQVTEVLSDRSQTERGRERCRAALPRLTSAEATQRLAAVEAIRASVAAGDPPALGGVADVRAAVGRAARDGVLEPEELVAVAGAVRALARMGRWLAAAAERFPAIDALDFVVPDLLPLAAGVERCFDPPDHLRDDASEVLTALRAEAGALHERTRRRIQQYLSDHGFDTLLQDRFWSVRGDRYVLPIKVEQRGRVPGIVHDTSQTGQTVFIEPEPVVDLNNKLKIATAEMRREERRILAELSARVAARADVIEAASQVAAELDALAARAQLADDLEATAPVVVDPLDDTRIELRAARHPLLVLEGVEVVANNLAVGGTENRVLLVSGPNAGGKTIALKTIGLAVLMARSGIPIAAKSGSRVPAFHEVITDVGDEQDLARDLSTFTAHLLNLRYGLQRAGPQTVLLLDEIGAGTEPSHGAALAGAALEKLAERMSTVIATTHDGRVKALVEGDERMENASFSLDPETRRPTFRLDVGVAGVSSAFDLAAALELDEGMLARARELAGESSSAMDRALASLARKQRALEQQQAGLQEELQVATREKEKLQRARIELRERERDALRGKRGELGAAMDGALANLRRVERELRARQTDAPLRDGLVREARAVIQAARRTDGEVAHEIAISERTEPPGLPIPAGELRPGLPVQVSGFGTGVVGVVREVQGDRVVVAAMGKSIEVGREALRRVPPSKGTGGAPPRSERSSPPPEPERATSSRGVTPRASWNTLDMRGQRVDEAMGLLDRFLDKALRDRWTTLYVLHGHGTGALKRASRSLLAARSEWCRFHAGPPDAGGDGVTIVHLVD